MALTNSRQDAGVAVHEDGAHAQCRCNGARVLPARPTEARQHMCCHIVPLVDETRSPTSSALEHLGAGQAAAALQAEFEVLVQTNCGCRNLKGVAWITSNPVQHSLRGGFPVKVYAA